MSIKVKKNIKPETAPHVKPPLGSNHPITQKLEKSYVRMKIDKGNLITYT